MSDSWEFITQVYCIDSLHRAHSSGYMYLSIYMNICKRHILRLLEESLSSHKRFILQSYKLLPILIDNLIYSLRTKFGKLFDEHPPMSTLFVRSSRKAEIRSFFLLSVCLFGQNSSKAHNLHRYDSGLSFRSHRSLLGLPQVSLRSFWGLSQVFPRSVTLLVRTDGA